MYTECLSLSGKLFQDLLMNAHEILYFFGFILFILSVLAIDLEFVSKHSHIVPFKEAITWTAIWVSLALILYFLIMFYGDRNHGIQNYDHISLRKGMNGFKTTAKCDLGASMLLRTIERATHGYKVGPGSAESRKRSVAAA